MLYHVTPSENVGSILKVGLVPRVGEASRLIGEGFPHVYLFTSLGWAKESIETWLGEVYRDKDLSVLSVDAVPEEIGGEVHGGEVLVDKVVPFSLIQVLYPPEEIDRALEIEC